MVVNNKMVVNNQTCFPEGTTGQSRPNINWREKTLKSVNLILDWIIGLLSHLIPFILPLLQNRIATYHRMLQGQVCINANHIRVCCIFFSNTDALMA